MTENPLENALKQIQTWFVNGEFEKAKQGCEEVLKVSPNNSIAEDLLEKINETMAVGANAQEPIMPQEEMIAPSENPEPYNLGIPMKTPGNEPSNPVMPMPEAIPTMEDHKDYHKKHSLIVNISILAGILLIGIGGVYAYYALFENENENETASVETNVENSTEKTETIDETEEIKEPEAIKSDEDSNRESPEMEERNAERSADLSSIEKALLNYYDAFKKYPTADEMNTVLTEQGFLESMPTPPTEGEVYIYAVYDTDLGPQQTYILSGEFETETGETETWSTGGNTLEFTDFNDLTQSHVIALESTLATESQTQTESEESDEEKTRVPRS